MVINSLKVEDKKFDVNLEYYNFLKKITQAKFTINHLQELLTIYYSSVTNDVDKIKEAFYTYIETIKRENLSEEFAAIEDINNTNIQLFIYSIKLNLMKDLLLSQAKLKQVAKSAELKNFNPLSLSYDRISTQVAYATRINGALLSLLIFEDLDKGRANFATSGEEEFYRELIEEHRKMLALGVEPNQIFMLLFSESINQSITSSAGASYEDRIKNILIEMGINENDIRHLTRDEGDNSTEFDFEFNLNGKKYGVGAKRTLRERYKQFIKTAQSSNYNVMIEITLGIDLRKNIAESIRKYGVYLFVADEVYDQFKYLKDIEGIFPARDFTIETLNKLK